MGPRFWRGENAWAQPSGSGGSPAASATARRPLASDGPGYGCGDPRPTWTTASGGLTTERAFRRGPRVPRRRRTGPSLALLAHRSGRRLRVALVVWSSGRRGLRRRRPPGLGGAVDLHSFDGRAVSLGSRSGFDGPTEVKAAVAHVQAVPCGFATANPLEHDTHSGRQCALDQKTKK